MAPDLRASLIPLDKKAFTSIVRDGMRNDKGMPSFPEISDENLESLIHFIRIRAKETLPQYELLTNKGPVLNNSSDVKLSH